MILVTGGTGFVGTRLVSRLLQDKERVRLLVRNPSVAHGQFEEVAGRLEIASGSVTAIDAVNAAMQDIEFVVHLAAIGSPSIEDSRLSKMMEINIGGTANVMAAAGRNGVKKVVIASSSAVYGNSLASPKPEVIPIQPASAYGVSKIAAEQLCQMYGERHRFNYALLRFFNIYGPGQDPHGISSMLVPRLIRSFENQEPMYVYGGEQKRDYVHVDDCVRAITNALRVENYPSGAFNIGTGVGTSVNELVNTIRAITAKTPNIEFRPARDGDVLESVADINRACVSLRFQPEVAIKQGLLRLLGNSHVPRRSGTA